MSRRQVARMASPEEVFAQRRGETPYQIYFEISNIGRNVESSKKRARWKFCFGEEGREHEVTLVHSLMSGKKKTIFNGEVINEAQKMSKEWSFAWSFGAHLLRVGINFEEYHLVIDSLPFMSFSRRDPYLAAQLEATKRDSMKSLKSDEERRFERLGYAGVPGGGGGGGRSRTAERGQSSSRSINSAGSRRASSTGRGRDADGSLGPRRLSDDGTASNRSGSVDRRAERRRSSPVTRTSSTSRMRSPPSAVGSGDQRRATKSGNVRASSSSAAAGQRSVSAAAATGSRSGGIGGGGGGGGGSKGPVQQPAAEAADILSADPSTLEVNPFDAYVGEGSFDPLNKASASAAAGGAGIGYTNGVGAPAAGGGWAGGGDTAAVLNLGMQFEAMGGNSQFQQQQQQQQPQFGRPQQQPPQQQQQEQYQQSPFDQGGGYQQYDQTAFPQNVQQTYQAAPQQQSGSSWPFGDSDPIVGGAPGADGGVAFSGGGYPDQGQQQQQQPYQQGMLNSGMAEQSAEASKASLEPWDMARGGLVNIDDITDTKHLPAVEVKPFTNDHRPLADLVREAPAKVVNSVMIERPEPPTHVAVAIVPYQPPGQQQQAGYAQGGIPQQNGNPFGQLQLTQFGQPQQPQPVLFSKPGDPFYRL